jgi:hypothetical protein
MQFSVIVCTRNRAAALARCLASFAQVTAPAGGWELLVVDNGSTDATARVIQTAAEQLPMPVRRVTVRTPGLAHARNGGVAHARGALLAFTDDDCYPHADWLRDWAAVYADAAVSYGGGRIELHDPADAPVTVRTCAQAEPLPAGSFIRTGCIQGANFSVRRTAYDAIGGFDGQLGPGTPFNCEDVDFVSRLARAGYAGGYFPGPTVRHHHGRKPGPALADLHASYDRGRGAYYAKTLLAPGQRWLYLRQWYWQTRRTLGRGGWRQVGRELGGALHYWGHSALHTGRRVARQVVGLHL